MKWLVGLLACSAGLYGCPADCNKASDCEADEVCYLNVCTQTALSGQSCQSTMDCTGGFICIGGSCVLPPRDGGQTVLDTGVDSGTPIDAGDTGVVDMGMGDTGMMMTDAGDAGMMTPDTGASANTLVVDINQTTTDFSANASARFDGQMSETIIAGVAGTDSITISIPGPIGVGMHNCSPTGMTVTRMALNFQGAGYNALNQMANCTVDITQYGAAGQNIVGTFSGTLVGGPGNATLTNGSFSIVRSQ